MHKEDETISESFATLEIDSDMILQFFFWSRMNETMQNQFIQMTNNNKQTLKQIQTHMFDATERYLTSSRKNVKCKELVTSNAPKFEIRRESTTVSAAAVNYKERSCDRIKKKHVL